MYGASRRVSSAAGWIAVWAILAVAPIANAASEPPNPPDRGPLSLRLDHLDAYLELEAELDRTRIESSSRRRFEPDARQRNRAWTLEERIGLSFAGSAADPGLLTFGGEIAFALTQSRFKERFEQFLDLDRTDDDNGHLLTYDLRVNVLPGQKRSGSAYGLRQDDRINRRFQPTLNQRRTGFGTNWYYADQKLPMELSYDYLDTDRTGNADPSDDEHFSESTFHYGFDWNIARDHKLRFSYEHADTKQNYQGLRRGFETTRDLFIVEHDYKFGEQQRHDFRTLIHWQEESGDFARDFFQFGPQLTLRHSDTLQTLYKYQFDHEQYDDLDVDTHRVDFQIVHQLYTNLTTTFGVFGLYEDVEDDVDTTQYGASVDWQYNRKNRYGNFLANLALAYDTEEFDGDNGRRLVLNESHTFRDPVGITLRNRNVIRTAIVVTDATNLRIFLPGRDYFVRRIGNAMQVFRVPSGGIADGDTVLVDYTYRTPADGRLDTIRVDLNLEQRFGNGLTPYSRLSYRNQEDDTSTGFARYADRTDNHRLGVTCEKQRYTVGGEIEIFDDTVEPYDAFHLNGLYHLLQRPDHNLDASARVSRLFLEGGLDDRNVTMVDVALDHRWRVTDALSTVERIAYRHEDDSDDGTTNNWDVAAGFEYVYGDLSAELTFEYDRLDLPGSDEESVGLYFRMRREIPDVFVR
jgi:hypothetical protein